MEVPNRGNGNSKGSKVYPMYLEIVKNKSKQQQQQQNSVSRRQGGRGVLGKEGDISGG